MDKVRFEVVEGVVIEIDPALWDVRGIPLGLRPLNQPSALQFDLSLAQGDHASKIENLLTLSKVRR